MPKYFAYSTILYKLTQHTYLAINVYSFTERVNKSFKYFKGEKKCVFTDVKISYV